MTFLNTPGMEKPKAKSNQYKLNKFHKWKNVWFNQQLPKKEQQTNKKYIREDIQTTKSLVYFKENPQAGQLIPEEPILV